MILNIICFKNEKIKAFTQPQFIDVDPEKAALQLCRSIQLNADKASPYQNLTMWYLGSFDDETGIISQIDEMKFLCDCRKVCKEVKDEFLHDDREKE